MKIEDMFTENDTASIDYKEFKVIGDSIIGTYVNRRMATDKYGEKVHFDIMLDDGKIKTVSSKPGLSVDYGMQLKDVQRGQIVGIKLIDLKDVGKGNPCKIFNVYADKSKVNKEWLEEQRVQRETLGDPTPDPQIEVADEGSPEETISPIDSIQFNTEEKAKPMPEPVVDLDKLAKIKDLTTKKFGAKTAEEVKEIVIKETNLAFTIANADAIIEKLESLK